MKILNKTIYDTGAIRSLLSEAYRGWLKKEGRQRKNLEITVTHTRQKRGCSGEAYYHGYKITLRIPAFRESDVPPEIVQDFVAVFYHELEHCYGWHHRHMPRHDFYRRIAEWAKDRLLPRKNPDRKPRRDLQWERYQRVLQKVREWSRKHRLALTYLKKVPQGPETLREGTERSREVTQAPIKPDHHGEEGVKRTRTCAKESKDQRRGVGGHLGLFAEASH